MKCPICGGDSGCGLNKTESCWCVQVNISSTLLKLVSSEQLGKACICSKCVEKSEKSSK